MPVDKFGRMSDAKTKDTGVSLTYINNNYIRSDGNTPVAGSINMNGNTLYNVPEPVNPHAIATKEYADTKTNIIAVQTQYYGPLIKDKYQFTFGEGIKETSFSGFLIPHSGRIKKIAAKLKSYFIWKKDIVGDVIKYEDKQNLLGSLFSIFITRNEDGVKTRLANFIGKRDRYIEVNYKDESKSVKEYFDLLFEAGKSFNLKYLFDNFFENYPVSEGDLINIRTEKDYNTVKFINPLELKGFEGDAGVSVFFYLFDRVRPVIDNILNNLF